MTTQMTATVVNGMLKPDQPLPLAELSRVRLTIEPIEDWSPERAKAAWEALQIRLKQYPIDSGGVRYTREQLHERH